MIPKKILSIFEFIDYLDVNKPEYIEKYIPMCNDLEKIIVSRSELRPEINYIEKLKYDIIQNEINEKLSPIILNVFIPLTEKLKELGIWLGDQTYSSIWNVNISAISDFKVNFSSEDISQVIAYKKKYLAFRIETNTYFLCLQLVFCELDEVLKALFDFFKDTSENEFDRFEAKVIEVNSIADAVNSSLVNVGRHVKFNISNKCERSNKQQAVTQKNFQKAKYEIVMGDKISVGDIKNNSGYVILGKDIRVSNSLGDKQESFDRIEKLINIISENENIDSKKRQVLITNFDKVKEEILEESPDKSKILKWLSNTKVILETLVLSHDVTEAVHWVYDKFNFVVNNISS
jgi:hypothetical protein